MTNITTVRDDHHKKENGSPKMIKYRDPVSKSLLLPKQDKDCAAAVSICSDFEWYSGYL